MDQIQCWIKCVPTAEYPKRGLLKLHRVQLLGGLIQCWQPAVIMESRLRRNSRNVGRNFRKSSIVSPELGLHKSVLNRTRAIISCNEPNETFVQQWYPGHQISPQPSYVGGTL